MRVILLTMKIKSASMENVRTLSSKGMLQHSRASSGQKELADINAIADEYLHLAYHGFRAKDKLFNSTILTDFDPTIGKINIVPQDMGRVY